MNAANGYFKRNAYVNIKLCGMPDGRPGKAGVGEGGLVTAYDSSILTFKMAGVQSN